MHVRTYFRQRRGTRTITEAARATGINKAALSRIERGEQFSKSQQATTLARFYDQRAFTSEAFADAAELSRQLLRNLYPASVLRCLQLERKCACGCGSFLPPESIRSRRYCEGHRRHVRTPASREEGR
jgi:DNA-binding XRE family transcriptional regulator